MRMTFSRLNKTAIALAVGAGLWFGLAGISLVPAVDAYQGQLQVRQVRNGSGMGGGGSTEGPYNPHHEDPTQPTISIPVVAIYVDPDPIIFIPPLSETP